MTAPQQVETDMVSGRIAIGVDVGGSGIKAAVVDTESGRFRSDRLRVATPKPSTPDRISASISRLVKRLAASSGISEAAPVGVGLPGVAMHGKLVTAANIDPAWVDYPVAENLTKVLKRPVSIVNDADAAGIAEMRFGVGAGKRGVVIFLTLGTGRRVRHVRGRGARPEHGVRPDGDPRPGRRASFGVGRANPQGPLVEGLGDGPR